MKPLLSPLPAPSRWLNSFSPDPAPGRQPHLAPPLVRTSPQTPGRGALGPAGPKWGGGNKRFSGGSTRTFQAQLRGPGHGLGEFGVPQAARLGVSGRGKIQPRRRGWGPFGAASPPRPSPPGTGRESRVVIGRSGGVPHGLANERGPGAAVGGVTSAAWSGGAGFLSSAIQAPARRAESGACRGSEPGRRPGRGDCRRAPR